MFLYCRFGFLPGFQLVILFFCWVVFLFLVCSIIVGFLFYVIFVLCSCSSCYFFSLCLLVSWFVLSCVFVISCIFLLLYDRLLGVVLR